MLGGELEIPQHAETQRALPGSWSRRLGWVWLVKTLGSTRRVGLILSGSEQAGARLLPLSPCLHSSLGPCTDEILPKDQRGLWPA